MGKEKPVNRRRPNGTTLPATVMEDLFGKRVWLAALCLVVVALIVYQPVWRAGFIWDDDDHLTANPVMTAPHGLRVIWSSLAASRYYPLTLTTFWALHRWCGLNPLPYHLVNVTLHAVNGLLIFFMLRRLRVPAAWLVAAFWVLHPVNVESVAWVTELKNTQSGFFFFLALLCFLRWETDGRRRWYGLSLVCAAGAVLSKPSTVILPVILLFCIWWERRRWQRVDFVRIVPFFGLAAGMAVLTVMEQHGHILRAGSAEWNLGFAERVVIAGQAVWFYAAKVLWPVQLMFVYPQWDVRPDLWTSWLPVIGVCAGCASLWACRRQPWAPAVLLATGCFAVGLLPIIGFVDVYYFRYAFVADHFQYLASVALIAGLTGAAARISGYLGRLGRTGGVVAGTVALVVLGALTWRQAGVYRDSETLWRDTLAKNPGCWMAHNNLGEEWAKTGRIQEALGQYEQALRIDPELAVVHYNLANVLSQIGRLPEAIRHYEQALRIRPQYAAAHSNLGHALQQTGKLAGAIREYQRALQIEPALANVHDSLGNALSLAGRTKEAIHQYELALQISPTLTETHNNLGTVLFRDGQVEEAIGHYEQALQIRPGYAEAHSNLAGALQQAGRLADALRHYEQALQINPNLAAVHYNLGNALVQAGRIEDAIRHYDLALQINPDSAPVHYSLANILLQAGRTVDARGHYEQALRISPELSAAHYNLGNIDFRAGRFAAAIQHYEQELRIDPRDVEVWFNLGLAVIQAGTPQDAVRCYARAIQIKPDYVAAQNNLARLLAVLPPAMGGDAERALALAQRVCEFTHQGVAAYVDTLAIAYAAAGRFTDAVAAAQTAIELSRAAGQQQWVKEIEARQELFRTGHTYRQFTGPSEPPHRQLYMRH